MLRTRPIIVILGSTGTGKTKLSIELARRFGGEIISADSMQVYRGLDIATAKATAAEQAAATHHLLDVAQPGRPYTVVDFRDAALPIIERLLAAAREAAEPRLPIVVGGTNYYIESLLWQVLVSPPTTTGDKRRRSSSAAETTQEDTASAPKRTHRDDTAADSDPATRVQSLTDIALESMASADLHALLAAVDPAQANRLHPNNRRKSIRALQIFRDCGRPMSAVLAAQQTTPGGSQLGGPLRYRHVILLWLRCDAAVLERRLDARIDDMVAGGLLPEIRAFYDGLSTAGDQTTPTAYTKGILQTIGFKEFIPYLERYDSEEDARITEYMRRSGADSAGDAPAGVPLLHSCLDELRLVTKRYAKKQLKWVTNRFCAANGREVPPVYELDSSSPADWAEHVFGRAEHIVESYMSGETGRYAPVERLASRRGELSEDVTNVCTTCDRTFIGEFQWRIHLRSNKHRLVVERQRRAAETAACDVVKAPTAPVEVK